MIGWKANETLEKQITFWGKVDQCLTWDLRDALGLVIVSVELFQWASEQVS